jgi:hypothetical protein
VAVAGRLNSAQGKCREDLSEIEQAFRRGNDYVGDMMHLKGIWNSRRRRTEHSQYIFKLTHSKGCNPYTYNFPSTDEAAIVFDTLTGALTNPFHMNPHMHTDQSSA